MNRNSANAAPRRGATWGGRPGRAARALIVLCAVATPVLASTSMASAATYDPSTDSYSMKKLTEFVGATAWWNAGYTGAGVDVALIDTGVSPVEGLTTPGKIINGPDLSLESQAANLTNLDTNGHGTFMAGLIAGKDSALTAPYAKAPASAYRGIAPDARVLSVKVATADGGTDVSQVIAAINWVVDHKNDNGMNIRVLNISFGADSNQSAAVDPLAFAAERAWKAGIVVVAAAGNSGYVKSKIGTTIASPAYNPYVIAVGGYDTNGTPGISDDYVGLYSQGSCSLGCKDPDFAAVGSHVQGLRVPNSYVDVNHSEGLLGARYFRGSGTSQAAAITAGSIALLLQKFPSMTPDQVKNFITLNAGALPGRHEIKGAGSLNLVALLTKKPSAFSQIFPLATGGGLIDVTRGDEHLTKDGVELTGEIDIFGMPFTASTAGSSWSGGVWNGSSWSGSSWSGSSWSGSSWSGSSWSGSSWSSGSWS